MSTIIPGSVSASATNFVERFYSVSDGRDVDAYLGFLTADVDFIMGLSVLKGEEAVRKLRGAMWAGVESRKHTPRELFEHADGSLMTHGQVEYVLSNGKEVTLQFASLLKFGTGENKDKLSKYQVWIDASPLAAAKA